MHVLGFGVCAQFVGKRGVFALIGVVGGACTRIKSGKAEEAKC